MLRRMQSIGTFLGRGLIVTLELVEGDKMGENTICGPAQLPSQFS